MSSCQWYHINSQKKNAWTCKNTKDERYIRHTAFVMDSIADYCNNAESPVPFMWMHTSDLPAFLFFFFILVESLVKCYLPVDRFQAAAHVGSVSVTLDYILFYFFSLRSIYSYFSFTVGLLMFLFFSFESVKRRLVRAWVIPSEQMSLTPTDLFQDAISSYALPPPFNLLLPPPPPLFPFQW